LRFTKQTTDLRVVLRHAVSMNNRGLSNDLALVEKKSACTSACSSISTIPLIRPSQGALPMTMCASIGSSNVIGLDAPRLPRFRSACVNQAVAVRLGVCAYTAAKPLRAASGQIAEKN
jgi:hypothetical protein